MNRDIQTDRQTARPTNRQTTRQTDRQTDRQIDIVIYIAPFAPKLQSAFRGILPAFPETPGQSPSLSP